MKMSNEILLPTNQNINNCIKAIGQELIRRSDYISNDIRGVQTISINATISPDEIVNFNITKNYLVKFKDRTKSSKEAE